ncbi:MAG: hypothetical protein MUF38_19080 [Anaerolineae bacterium]|nr:hypothetical protein [Anaerolineae bacterium]
MNWLGVDNILITGTTIPYETSFIAQVIGNEWYSQEFLVYTDDPGFSLGPGAWRLTADETEQKALRCLFVDRASSPIMSVGGRGQVAFTGGTPSRLRYLPGTDGSVAASLPEGTAFTVTGGPECGSVGWPKAYQMNIGLSRCRKVDTPPNMVRRGLRPSRRAVRQKPSA